MAVVPPLLLPGHHLPAQHLYGSGAAVGLDPPVLGVPEGEGLPLEEPVLDRLQLDGPAGPVRPLAHHGEEVEVGQGGRVGPGHEVTRVEDGDAPRPRHQELLSQQGEAILAALHEHQLGVVDPT